MRRTLAASSAALAVAAVARAAPAHDQPIRPGAGIGEVSLGTTTAQVRREREEFERLWARQARVSEVIVRAPGVRHPYELPGPR